MTILPRTYSVMKCFPFSRRYCFVFYTFLRFVCYFVYIPPQEEGMEASWLVEWSGFEPWPGTLCCVLG